MGFLGWLNPWLNIIILNPLQGLNEQDTEQGTMSLKDREKEQALTRGWSEVGAGQPEKQRTKVFLESFEEVLHKH